MLNLIHLQDINIFDQLRLEEALLRTSNDNFCIINTSSKPAIIMGVNSKPEDVINIKHTQKQKVPIIQRFSGGGCVFIDENTIFITFIFSKEDSPAVNFPEPIMRWTKSFYEKIINFDLLENDFVIKNKKFAGNAQYIKKNRWLQHTSFLFDYDINNMLYLLNPKKQPQYRKKRSHYDFLTPLRNVFSTKEAFINKIKFSLENTFKINRISYFQALEISKKDHRKTTKYIQI